MAEVKIDKIKPEETSVVAQDSPKKNAIRYSEEPVLRNKFMRAFFGDSVRDFKDYALNEIIAPGIKGMILGALENLFDVGARGPRRRRYKEDDEYVSYSAYYQSDRRKRYDDDYDDRYARDDYRNIGFYSKVEAKDVLDRLKDRLERSKRRYVTVLDFYDILQKSSKNPQDDKWGWTDLSYVTIERHGDKWYIEFPKIRYFD